jgi:sugar-specific transcriptional regulator TrmB
MKEVLEAIGFDEKEITIYLALLKVGQASVNELLQQTQIERRTIYDVLERLVQKGRASFYEENKRRVFMPTKPEVLLLDLEQKKESFKQIIPKLTQLEMQPKEVKVELLKGTQGLQTIFHEVIQKKCNHIAFGNISPLIYEKRYARIVKTFLQANEEQGLQEKIIFTKGDPINKIKKGQYRAVEKALVFPTPTLIYGNVVTQYIYTEPLTIIKITSDEVARTHKKYFEHFWKIAEK